MTEHKQRKRYFIRRKKGRTFHEENETMIVIKNGTLNEMAIPRKRYFDMALNQSKTVLTHIGKICVLGNLERFKGEIPHWEDEIGAQIYDLGRIDNKDKDLFGVVCPSSVYKRCDCTKGRSKKGCPCILNK